MTASYCLCTSKNPEDHSHAAVNVIANADDAGSISRDRYSFAPGLNVSSEM
jgi:hypothetical protein